MSVEFAVESVNEGWNDVVCLAIDRMHEEGVACSLSYEVHLQKEKAGKLLVCTARANGEMVGYAICSDDDSHFILPKYRNYESKLLGFAEDQREARGM